MPPFGFHIQDGTRPSEAATADCVDVQSARHAAAQMMGQMMADRSAEFDTNQDWNLTVVDAAGVTLLTVTVLALASPALKVI